MTSQLLDEDDRMTTSFFCYNVQTKSHFIVVDVSLLVLFRQLQDNLANLLCRRCNWNVFIKVEKKFLDTNTHTWTQHLPSISSTLNSRIFRTNIVLAVFSSYMYVVKAPETTFVPKICTFNVDEINTGVNFTNIFSLSFYACRSRKREKTDDLTVFFTLLGSVR